MLFLLALTLTPARSDNLTANLQQKIMDNALKESYKVFVEGRGRKRLLKPVPFSEYKTMDQWLAAAPRRFRAYNHLSEKAFNQISTLKWTAFSQSYLQTVFLDLYDFSRKLSADPKPGELHSVWTLHESLLRVLPERLFALRRLNPDHLQKKPCREVLNDWLNQAPLPGEPPYAQAAKVFLECSK